MDSVLRRQLMEQVHLRHLGFHVPVAAVGVDAAAAVAGPIADDVAVPPDSADDAQTVTCVSQAAAVTAMPSGSAACDLS